MSKYTVYDFVVADREMVAKGGGYSFRGYTDRAGIFGNPGAEIAYYEGAKVNGKSVGKAFTVNQSHYKLQAREGQKDYDGKTLVDYFKNAPFCLGSPNGDYVNQDGTPVLIEEVLNIAKNLTRIKSGELQQLNVKIKLMDDEKDAELALETGLKRAEAQMSTGAIDDQTLAEIASLIGVFGKVDKMMRHAVYEFAGKRPLDYFKLLEAGDRPIRAMIRRGLADGILTQKGSVIYWDKSVLGADENAVVATLLADESILKALQDKTKIKVDQKPKPKK